LGIDSTLELNYTVCPRYKYNCGYTGKVEKLKRSGYISVESIASGEVKFEN